MRPFWLLLPGMVTNAGLAGEADSAWTEVPELRGPHEAVFQKVITTEFPNGRRTIRTNSFVSLATGMHRQENGRWVPAVDAVEVFPDGAAARGTAHQVVFGPRVHTPDGTLDVLSPDGKRFRAVLLGLALTDAESGKSELIAEPNDARGELVPPNEIWYRNAFTALGAPVRADYRLRNSRAGVEADVILRSGIPSPVELGFNPSTTRLEIWTEFLEAPEPAVTTAVLRAQTDLDLRKRMVDPDLTDQTLDFGPCAWIRARSSWWTPASPPRQEPRSVTVGRRGFG